MTDDIKTEEILVSCQKCSKRQIIVASSMMISGVEAELFGQLPTLAENIANGTVKCHDCGGQLTRVLTDLPERLRSLAEAVKGIEWDTPLLSQETCMEAAKEIEERSDLAMMLRRLLHAIQSGCFGRKAKPPLYHQAQDLLQRLNLQGSPTREEDADEQ